MREKNVHKTEAVPIGFDHKDGPAKIFKSESNSSKRVKAACLVGPTLYGMCHDKKARDNRSKRINRKAKKMVSQLVPQGCAAALFCISADVLEKVSA